MTPKLQIEFAQGIRSNRLVWYRCIQRLGEGANATTLLVMATSGANRGVLFAMKIFQRISNAESRQRFLTEMAFLQACDHPSIMRTYDSGEFKAANRVYPFVVAEYLPSTLRDVIRSRVALLPEKIGYAIQLVSALNYLAHQDPPLVHRDIKPENIFVKGKSCVLGDFGLMKAITPGKESAHKARLRESRGAVMPSAYRTPDLIAYEKGEANLTAKSDIFQLGLVLTELFTGKNPCRDPESEDDTFVLDPVPHIPGTLGGLIHSVIKDMLEPDWSKRIDAAKLFDRWQTAFFEAGELSYQLNEKVF